jgi:hypothetical protein
MPWVSYRRTTGAPHFMITNRETLYSLPYAFSYRHKVWKPGQSYLPSMCTARRPHCTFWKIEDNVAAFLVMRYTASKSSYPPSTLLTSLIAISASARWTYQSNRSHNTRTTINEDGRSYSSTVLCVSERSPPCLLRLSHKSVQRSMKS